MKLRPATRFVMTASGFASLFASPARALIGEYIEPRVVVPQSCRILKPIPGGYQSICSSTQITSTELLTAAHCFNDYDGTQGLMAECPGQAPREIQVFMSEPNVDRIGRGPAIIRFAQPLATPPACMASPEELAELIQLNNSSDPRSCYFASYGYDNQKTFGNLHLARAGKLRLAGGQLVDDGGALQGGDSGGSFFCADKDGRWRLAGVNQGGHDNGLPDAQGFYKTTEGFVDSIQTVRKWVDAHTTGSRAGCAGTRPQAPAPEQPAGGACPPPKPVAARLHEFIESVMELMRRV